MSAPDPEQPFIFQESTGQHYDLRRVQNHLNVVGHEDDDYLFPDPPIIVGFRMRRLAQLLLITVCTIVVLILVLYMVVLSSPEVREVKEFEQRFSTVTIGDSKEEVIERLGKPDDVDGTFRLGQREGYEDAYERARNSGAKEFAFWFRGIDVVFSIGFDENDKVTLTEYGGT